MPRLVRPPINTETKLLVVLRQLGELFPLSVVEIAIKSRMTGRALDGKLQVLAELLNCEVKDLRLDHDPALGARVKVFNKAGEHVDYKPAASDPEFLFYRPHGPQFERSHLVKTNVRGDHGQHPDRVLIVKNRRLEKRLAEGQRRRRTPFLIKKPQRRPPRKGRSKPLKSASRWPSKGTRKINWRKK